MLEHQEETGHHHGLEYYRHTPLEQHHEVTTSGIVEDSTIIMLIAISNKFGSGGSYDIGSRKSYITGRLLRDQDQNPVVIRVPGTDFKTAV